MAIICGACRRVVEKPLDETRSGEDTSSWRKKPYPDAITWDETPGACVICRMLLEKLTFHSTTRVVLYEYTRRTGRLYLKFSVSAPGRNEWDSGRRVLFMCLEPWSTISTFGPGDMLVPERPEMMDVPESTGDGRCVALASKWIQLCYKNHARCNARRDTDYRPPRLLRLGGEHVFLVSRSDLPAYTPMSYATLSYCWGENPNFLRLTNANEAKLRGGVQLATLPPMMKDAIKVTKGLSLDYLWVDCLCILQEGPGSDEDWEAHVREMRKTYQNCIVSIAAAAAESPNEPLFRRRIPSELRPDSFEVRDGRNCPTLAYTARWNDDLEHEREGRMLSKRGWVLQERMLSPRLITLSDRQFHWECSMTTACEAFPQGLPAVQGIHRFDIFPERLFRHDRSLGFQLHRDKGRADVDWHRFKILERYTQRSLSLPLKDKFVAIAAIMETLNAVPEIRPEDYIAGFLRRDLPVRLYWSTMNHSYDIPAIGSSEYRAPSWSWAAADEACRFFVPSLKPISEMSMEDPQWEVVDKRNPYGRVSSAKLVFHGPLITVAEGVDFSNFETLDAERAVASGRPRYLLPAVMREFATYTLTTSPGGSIYEGQMCLDNARYSNDGGPTIGHPMQLLPLGIYDNSDLKAAPPVRQLKGIVIKALEKGRFGADAYVRIGSFTVQPREMETRCDKKWISRMLSKLETRKVNLL